MLLRSLHISKDEFEAGTGWTLKPEGACQGDVCIPLSKPAGDRRSTSRRVAKDMGMPLVAAPESACGRWGRPASDRARWPARKRRICGCPISTASHSSLSSLRGQKVLLYAWAPY